MAPHNAISVTDPAVSHGKLRVESDRFFQQLDGFRSVRRVYFLDRERVIAISLEIICHHFRDNRSALLLSRSGSKVSCQLKGRQINLHWKLLDPFNVEAVSKQVLTIVPVVELDCYAQSLAESCKAPEQE